MNRYLKFVAPLVIIIFLAGCSSQRTVYDNRDYDRNPMNDRGNWTLLGERNVDYRGNSGVIYPRYGNFSQLQISTGGGQVYVYRATIVYDNGRRESVNLGNQVSRSGQARVINLRSRGRSIREISFEYNTDRYSRQRGSVFVYGR